MDDLKLKLRIFEGPLDLLLHLVRVNEVDIYEISIAQITDQYLEYLRLLERLDLEVAGDFIVMAATLMNIKLRSLLPDHGESQEPEEEEIGDITTAQELLRQLVEYRKFKEAAHELQGREEFASRVFFREQALPVMAKAHDDDELRIELDKLLNAFSRVIRFVEARGWHAVTEEEYSVEEKIDLVQLRLRGEKRIVLDDLFTECKTRVEMIVTVLALLELCRQKLIRIEQPETYGQVAICPRDEVPGEDGGEARVIEIKPEEKP